MGKWKLHFPHGYRTMAGKPGGKGGIPTRYSQAKIELSLFDMEKDPNQTTDVAGKNPKIVKAMRAAYDKFWKEARPLMVNEKAPMSPTRPYHVLHAKQLKEGGIPNSQPPKL